MDLLEFSRGDDAALAGAQLSRTIATTHVREMRRRSAAVLRTADVDLLNVERGTVPPDPIRDIFGAGVIEQPDGLRPVVVVHERLAQTPAPRERLPALSDLPEVVERLSAVGADIPRSDTVVLALPPTRPQYGPGRHVRASGANGTLGARVVTADGREAILTAGHVVTAGDVARNAADQLADCIFSIDPAQVPAAQVAADVAVLVPHLPTAWSPGVPISGACTARAGDRVDLSGSVSGQQTSRVVGAMPEYWLSATSGLWASVLITAEGFSTEGDSGGPVTAQGTTELVGHLVGGSGAVTSFVQTLDVQLSVSGVALQV